MIDSQYERLIEKAKIAEQIERYEDMADFMKKAVELERSKLTSEERNLLSVAYKNVIGAKRFSWRVISGIEDKETDERKNALEKMYIRKIEKELQETCEEVLSLIKDHLEPNCSDDSEGRVFYLKLRGDYLRYLAEIPSIREDKEDVIAQSEAAYKEANELSKADLEATHPTRLGLALNFSVFYYEILKAPDKAIEFAKQAVDDFHVDLDKRQEDGRTDSQLIVQLLRDNLALWKSTKDEDEDEDDNK